MRVNASSDPKLIQFDSLSLRIGDGEENDHNNLVKIPSEFFIKIGHNQKGDMQVDERSMKSFCQEIYPNLMENITDATWLTNWAILAPTNKEVDMVNYMVASWVFGTENRLYSSDHF